MARSLKEQNAMVEATLKMLKQGEEELKKIRKPCEQNDNIVVNVISGEKMIETGEFKRTNGEKVKTNGNEVSIKVAPGGYVEMNGKENNEQEIGE